MKLSSWITVNCRFAQSQGWDSDQLYSKEPRSGWTPYERRPDAPNQNGDRPHGSNSKSESLEISEQGILPIEQFIAKFWRLEEDVYRLEKTRKDLIKKGLSPKEKFAAYILTNVSKSLNPWVLNDPNVIYHAGWSSSFHDAQWTGHSMIAGLGETEEAAKAKLQEAWNASVTEDPVKKRFDLRSLVRSGD